MVDKIVAIHNGRLSLSPILYYCDLRQASGTTIPLGVIAEMTYGPLRVLGLIAQKRLSDVQLRQVGRAYQPKMVTPFAFLRARTSKEYGRKPTLETLYRHSRSIIPILCFSPRPG